MADQSDELTGELEGVADDAMARHTLGGWSFVLALGLVRRHFDLVNAAGPSSARQAR